MDVLQEGVPARLRADASAAPFRAACHSAGMVPIASSITASVNAACSFSASSRNARGPRGQDPAVEVGLAQLAQGRYRVAVGEEPGSAAPCPRRRAMTKPSWRANAMSGSSGSGTNAGWPGTAPIATARGSGRSRPRRGRGCGPVGRRARPAGPRDRRAASPTRWRCRRSPWRPDNRASPRPRVGTPRSSPSGWRRSPGKVRARDRRASSRAGRAGMGIAAAAARRERTTPAAGCVLAVRSRMSCDVTSPAATPEEGAVRLLV